MNSFKSWVEESRSYRNSVQSFEENLNIIFGQIPKFETQLKAFDFAVLPFKLTLAKKLESSIDKISDFEILNNNMVPLKWQPQIPHIFKLKNGDNAMWVRYRIKNQEGGNNQFLSLWNLDKDQLLAFVYKSLFGPYDLKIQEPKNFEKAFEQYQSLEYTIRSEKKKLISIAEQGDKIFFVCCDENNTANQPNVFYTLEGGQIRSYRNFYESNGKRIIYSHKDNQDDDTFASFLYACDPHSFKYNLDALEEE